MGTSGAVKITKEGKIEPNELAPETAEIDKPKFKFFG